MSKDNNSYPPTRHANAHRPGEHESRRIYVPSSRHEETYLEGLFLAAALSAASGYTSAQGSSPMPPSVREALFIRNEIPLRSVSAFLALSGLSRFNLRVILHAARGTLLSDSDATISRQEFYTAIRLVQFRQNGVSTTVNLETERSREDGSNETAPLRPAYFHTVSGRSVPFPLQSISPSRRVSNGEENAHVLRLPMQKEKSVPENRAHVCQQEDAPSNTSAQEQHYRYHRRAHTVFQLDFSTEDEERSPSFDDDLELRRHRAISIASQTDCDDASAPDAEERDDL